eukprot:scaffold66354_cov63-Phaeocystis_antarctica.AAC.2
MWHVEHLPPPPAGAPQCPRLRTRLVRRPAPSGARGRAAQQRGVAVSCPIVVAWRRQGGRRRCG